MTTTTKPFRLLALAALLLGFGACTDEREGQIDHISASDGALCFSLPPLDGFVEAGTRAAVVPGYEKGDRPWQAGDVVLAKMSLTETNAGGAEVNRYDIYTTLTVPTAAGATTTTWTVDAGAAVPVMYFANGGFNAEKSNGDAGYELLKTETDGSISLVPPSGAVGNKLQISTTLYYHPNAKWEKVGSAYQPGGTAAPATIAQWKAEAVSNTTTYPLQQVALNSMVRTATNFSNKAFKAMCHRVRVYTGRPNFLVKLTSTKFQGAVPSASGVAALKTSETTYTALTNAAGNAYFYGITPEVLDGNGDKGFNIFLPDVDIPDGAGFKTEDISIYDASLKTKVDLTFGAKASARAIDAVWALSDDMVTSALIDVSAADINFVPDKLKDKMAEYIDRGKYDLYIIGMDKAEAIGDASATTAALYEAMNTLITSLHISGNTITLHLLDAPKVTGSAFNKCNNLGSIDLPEVTVIEDGVITPVASATGAFYNCPSLSSFTLPKVTKVGNNAFSGCSKLSSINLPKVNTVGDYAFNNCSGFNSLDLPEVVKVGNYAFSDCTSLESVHLPVIETLDQKGSFKNIAITSITTNNFPKVKTLGQNAFDGCVKLITVDLPLIETLMDGTSIKDAGPFVRCSSLVSAKLPNATAVTANCFFGCNNLTDVNVNSATRLGEYAFGTCFTLSNIELPSVTTVGASAFYGCPKLTQVTFKAIITDWGGYVFQGYSGMASKTYNIKLILNAGQKQNFDLNGVPMKEELDFSKKNFGGYSFNSIQKAP